MWQFWSLWSLYIFIYMYSIHCIQYTLPPKPFPIDSKDSIAVALFVDILVEFGKSNTTWKGKTFWRQAYVPAESSNYLMRFSLKLKASACCVTASRSLIFLLKVGLGSRPFLSCSSYCDRKMSKRFKVWIVFRVPLPKNLKNLCQSHHGQWLCKKILFTLKIFSLNVKIP